MPQKRTPGLVNFDTRSELDSGGEPNNPFAPEFDIVLKRFEFVGYGQFVFRGNDISSPLNGNKCQPMTGG
jgi:hypothetical protein